MDNYKLQQSFAKKNKPKKPVLFFFIQYKCNNEHNLLGLKKKSPSDKQFDKEFLCLIVEAIEYKRKSLLINDNECYCL